MATTDMSVEDIEARYKTLVKRKDAIQANKLRLEAELATRKRALKEVMEDCKKAGYNPDAIMEEIARAKEVLSIKLDNFAAELDSAESVMNPMLKEIG